MKSFVRLALLVATLGLAATPVVHAAHADHPRGKLAAKLRQHAAIRHHAAKKLGLSSDQISALKAERASTIASLKSLRHDASLTKEQKRAKARETVQAARAKARSVLTPDQQAKVKQFRAKHRHRR